ncbi:PadR family transcriptional regulator [Spongisporangium articulatum]|uniref:PadR family transcriptional regulator n=1 Tax=Spongisporangium articulatum TaxID=3362603 RepID=A0ABW8AH36_9ACTN
MAKRPVNNLLGLAVLAYLTRRPMHPYELSKTLRDNGDARSIKFTHGSLYMVFGQLQKAGLIEPVETNRAGARPERTLYALTPAGGDELRDWLRDLLGRPEHEYPHFVAALSLVGALTPDEVVPLLRARRSALEGQRDDARGVREAALAAGVHPLFLVEEDYRETLLNAEIGFVERFLGQIEGGWAADWGGTS